jgi:PAS domain-containing protein
MMPVFPDKTAGQGKETLRSKHILEGTPIPTFVVDATCKLTHWNRACHSLTGFGPEDLVGTDRHREVFYPKRRMVLADLIIIATCSNVPTTPFCFSKTVLFRCATRKPWIFSSVPARRWSEFHPWRFPRPFNPMANCRKKPSKK